MCSISLARRNPDAALQDRTIASLSVVTPKSTAARWDVFPFVPVYVALGALVFAAEDYVRTVRVRACMRACVVLHFAFYLAAPVCVRVCWARADCIHTCCCKFPHIVHHMSPTIENGAGKSK